jgi:acetylornithine deacetylase
MERYREATNLWPCASRFLPSLSHLFSGVKNLKGIANGLRDRSMNVFELTRALVDIESITGNEYAVGAFLQDFVSKLAARTNGQIEHMEVEKDRFNVFASWGVPLVVLSTHMDTVPPFFPSREDAEFIWGRGSCDAKGIAAAMIGAAEKLLSEGARNFGLLFVVGEERNSTGALAAAQTPRGSRYLINGEPTENKLAIASKGALRLEIHARGHMAHSAYPELGESAINALLDALEKVRRISLPHDSVLGLTTLNIGTIAGGRAPNVIADEAHAEVLVRLTGDAAIVRDAIAAAIDGRAELKEVLAVPVIHFERVDGLPTTIVSYTTDVPALCPAWGKPVMLGPGSILVAHTAEERMPKRELAEAVQIYANMVQQLQTHAQL